MLLTELFDKSPDGMQDIKNDNSKPVWRTSRKTKLTLKQIRELRRMLDVRNFERKQYIKDVQRQYGNKSEEQQPGAPTI